LYLIKRKIVVGNFGKVLIRFASSQLLSNFLKMLSGFLVVRLMAPHEFGLFTGIGVYTGYVSLGHFGIINGLGRELPYELGRGNEEYARSMASSAYVASVYISILAALLFFAFGVYYSFQHEWVLAISFYSYTIIGFITLLSKQFLPVLYRTNKDFDSLSRQNILTGVGNLVSVALVWWLGFWGLCIRGVALAVYEAILLFKNKPYKLEWKVDVSHYKKLFRTGFPIYLAGQINPLISTVMNNLVFTLGGAINMGFFALCTIVQGAIGIIPTAFGQVTYPRMTIMYGQGKKLSEIVRLNIRPLYFQFGVLMFAGIAGAILLPILVPILLPKYTPGIYAAQWMMFVPAVMSFGSLLNIFGVINKMRPFIIANICGGIVSVLFAFAMIKLTGFQLVIFPQALILGKIVQQVMSWITLRKLMKAEESQSS
jgi:O-antigen/teichoic acid export membrane protein